MKTKEKLEILNKMTPETILDRFWPENLIPVDINKLIQILGIKIIPYNFSKLEKSEKYYENYLEKGVILGAITTTENDIGIFYKYDYSSERIRFVLARELAHCCLHITSENDEYIDYKTNELSIEGNELEANIFASKLLIPEKELRYAQKNLIAPYLDSLIRIFNVPESVMIKRLQTLNLKYI